MIERRMNVIRKDPVKEDEYMEYEKRIREAAESAYDRGIAIGNTNATFDIAENLIENWHFNIEQAIQAAKVPADKAEEFRTKIIIKA